MEAWWIGLGMVLTWIGVYIFSPGKQTTTVQLVIGCVLLGFVSHEIYLFGTNAIHRAAAQPTSLSTLSEKNTSPFMADGPFTGNCRASSCSLEDMSDCPPPGICWAISGQESNACCRHAPL